MTLQVLSAEQQPYSPRLQRALKGESIRSLRGSFLQKSLSYQELEQSSTLSLPTSPVSSPENDNVNKEQHDEKIQQNEVAGSTADAADDTAKPIIENNNSAALPVLPSRRRPAHEVRLQFLQNLGIYQKPPPPPDPSTDNASSSNNNSTTTFEPWGPSYTGFLNDTDNDNDNDDDSSSCCPIKENRHIRFQPITKIHPIPSHKVYSNRIKQTIWTGAEELGDNVARNSLEFSYEEWNADNVIDEESGLIYFHGSWVHPVHFGNYLTTTTTTTTTTTQPPQQQQQQQSVVNDLSSDEIWRQEWQRLGIQPAEFYHCLQSSTTIVPTDDTASTTTTT
jgi:hypothetical protein